MNEAVGDAAEVVLRNALRDLERVWLKSTVAPFLCGLSQPSIADLLIACELEQLRLLDGAVKVVAVVNGWDSWLCCFALLHGHPHKPTQGPNMDELLTPGVRQWLEAVRQATNPAYDEAHTILKRAQSRFAQKRARM